MSLSHITGKITPNADINDDMGWNPLIIEQWKGVCNHWHRYQPFDNRRISKTILRYFLQRMAIYMFACFYK